MIYIVRQKVIEHYRIDAETFEDALIIFNNMEAEVDHVEVISFLMSEEGQQNG